MLILMVTNFRNGGGSPDEYECHVKSYKLTVLPAFDRQGISFNLSGPFLLMIATIFCLLGSFQVFDVLVALGGMEANRNAEFLSVVIQLGATI